jgi:hypothetical protein
VGERVRALVSRSPPRSRCSGAERRAHDVPPDAAESLIPTLTGIFVLQTNVHSTIGRGPYRLQPADLTGFVVVSPYFLSGHPPPLIRRKPKVAARAPAGVAQRRRRPIWIHAVSVGEALTARALVEDPPALSAPPPHLSTTTMAGQEVPRRSCSRWTPSSTSVRLDVGGRRADVAAARSS